MRTGEGEIDFTANIPQQIQADLDEKYAHLAGFPLNIMFTIFSVTLSIV
jgi:hypothetical protein